MNEQLAGGKLLLDRPAEAVVRLRISNPERRNALDHEILDALAEVMPQLDRGIETRCVLITGAPPVFSAGYDIAAIPEETFERDAEALVAHPFHAAMEAIHHHPWPTVAAINGHCLGGGLELAITCDLRICASGAMLGMPPAKLGLIYGHTGLRKFLDTIGLARTKELFLTGRNVGAERAERIGLVNEVVSEDRLAHEGVQLAAAIAANAPLSMRGNKSAIDLLNAAPVLSDQQEAGLVALRESCFASADLREGIRAFAEKRRPEWTGR
ncbi:MAG: enoyl-CoA hydratase [Solirubrobacterales bacterium]|nr:enoyl-CoA hydratase [Solirubrobacterales bacterium]HWC08009.1 enoyl-CoA hydratase-related protein [Solirubrobacterales bacterium]